MSSLASGNKLSLLFCMTLLVLMSLSRVAVFLGDFICPNLMNLKNPCPSVSMSMVLGTLPPPDVESLAGKKSKKWKQSLCHLDKPLSDFNLSVSHVITSQQGSSDNVNITVADNIDVSVSDVSGPVSDNLIRLALSLLTPLVLLCLPVSLSSLDLLLALNLCLLIQFSLLLLLIT